MARTNVVFFLALAITARTADARPQPTPSGAAPEKAIPRAPTSKWSAAGYVGDEVCGSCHQDKLQTFQQTVHHRTSQLPSAHSIGGKFIPPENSLRTIDPGLSFRMDAAHGSFYQTAVFGKPPSIRERSESFGLVIGSGRKGQTYLYWKGDELFELPVSYWVELAAGSTVPDIWTARQISTGRSFPAASNVMRRILNRSLPRRLEIATIKLILFWAFRASGAMVQARSMLSVINLRPLLLLRMAS